MNAFLNLPTVTVVQKIEYIIIITNNKLLLLITLIFSAKTILTKREILGYILC